MYQNAVWRICLAVLSISFVGATTATASPVSYKVDFLSQGTLQEIQFRAWVPDDVDHIRGLFVSFPGSNGDQQGITGSPLWQFRVAQMGYGIIGFRDAPDGFFDYWGHSSDEAHGNLQQMLDLVAESFDHPEISNAPVMLDGVSQGGAVAGWLASLVPERTLGFIADKGYFIPPNGAFESGDYQAPGLLIVGERDTIVPPDFIYPDFLTARTANANLAYLVEWGTAHRETSENMRLTYMNQIERARYPRGELPALTPGQPLQLNKPLGWLAEASTQNADGDPIYIPDPIHAAEQLYPLDPSTASWLPTEAMTNIYMAHNENEFTRPLINIIDRNLHFAEVQLSFQIGAIDWNRLEVFHNEQLIATLLPDGQPLTISYPARRNGLHTFVARAHYEDQGESRFTSNFITTTVFGAIPEPTTFALATGGIVLLLNRRTHQSNPH